MLAAILNGTYLHAHGKIILFNSEQEIQYFVQQFKEYSSTRAMTRGLFDLLPSIMSANVQIEEWNERRNNSITCGTVTYDELRK